MLSSQSTQAKDPSLFPLCSNDPTTSCGRSTSASEGEEPGDFDALFADLTPTVPPEPVPAIDAGAMFVPALNLAFLPPPVAMSPIPDLTVGAEGETAEGEELAGGVDEGVGPWFDHSGMKSDWAGLGLETSAALPSLRKNHGPGDVTTASPPTDSAAQSAWASSWSGVVPPAAIESNPVTTPSTSSLDPTRVRIMHAATTTGNGETASGLAPIPSGTEASDRVAAALTAADERVEGDRSKTDSFEVVSGPNASASDRPLRWEEFAANVRLGQRPSGEEKIAGAGEPIAGADASEGKARKKSFLSSGEELFTSRTKILGTDVARPVINMSAPHFNAPTTHPKSDYMMTAVNAAPSEVAGVATVEEPHGTFSTAHEAVEVVLHAVEHVASRAQRSVQLSFSVGGEELAVRVEMRSDEVRTTFRTDSAELRAALAQEWQQVSTSAHSDRLVRILPAVFAAAESSALNASAGDTSSRGRQQGAARGEVEAALAGIRGRGVANPAHPVALPSLTAPVRTRGSHRLHTLA